MNSEEKERVPTSDREEKLSQVSSSQDREADEEMESESDASTLTPLDPDEEMSSQADSLTSFYPHQIALSRDLIPVSRKVGKGMNNSNNTCYLNSCLQSLIHTLPLLCAVFSKTSDELTTTDNVNYPNFRGLTAFQRVAKRAMYGSGEGGSVWPSEISVNLLGEFDVFCSFFECMRFECMRSV